MFLAILLEAKNQYTIKMDSIFKKLLRESKNSMIKKWSINYYDSTGLYYSLVIKELIIILVMELWDNIRTKIASHRQES